MRRYNITAEQLPVIGMGPRIKIEEADNGQWVRYEDTEGLDEWGTGKDYNHARDCAYVVTDGPAPCTCHVMNPVGEGQCEHPPESVTGAVNEKFCRLCCTYIDSAEQGPGDSI